MKKVLYQWQEECLGRWFANHGRGMVQAATGSGKTLLALTAAERLEKQLNQELRVKIVVPTSALMRQWNQELREFLAKSDGNMLHPADIRRMIGMRGAGCKAPADCKYMIYVINSARYELARQILCELKGGAAVLLIADECHRYESGQNRLIFEFLPYIQPYEDHFFSLGLSATLPHGQAQSYLASVLGPRIYSYGINRASAMHTVCSYDIFHISLSFQRAERDEYEELTERLQYLYGSLLKMEPFLRDMSRKELFSELRMLAGGKNRKIARIAASYMSLAYQRRALVCLASARVSCVCALLERLPPTEKIIIFGERISQAEELYQLLQKRYPGKAGRYHSKMGALANKNTLNRFRDGEIRILIACKSMDEGIDVPDASVGIILSGTSVQRQRIQRLGRIIRKKEGKERALLYYLHLNDTVEDCCFLPDSKENCLFELEYLPDAGEFKHPIYDGAAADLLSQMELEGADAGKLKEVRRCLRLGCVRPDWMREPAAISAKISSAKDTEEKNYWICMKKIAENT